MQDWVDLINNGNLITIILVVIVLIATGGVGSSIVQGIVARNRGIKGDAISNDSNSIAALGKLTEGQDDFITQIRQELKDYKLEMNQKYALLEQKLALEIAHSEALTQQLINIGIIPVLRFAKDPK